MVIAPGLLAWTVVGGNYQRSKTDASAENRQSK